jgi:hypothetical protein
MRTNEFLMHNIHETVKKVFHIELVMKTRTEILSLINKRRENRALRVEEYRGIDVKSWQRS